MSQLPGERDTRVWSRAAYAYALVLALGLGYFLVRMPYQISDDLEHLLIFQFQTLKDVLVTRFTGPESMRPVMWLTQKLFYDVAPDGHYFATYKAVHVALLVAVLVLFVRLLRIRTATDFIALPLALTALVGIHTFNVTIREGYPVNHFMIVLACCLTVANLASSGASRGWHDLVAVLVFAYAVFMFESGVLVWVCIVTAYAAGWRGVSMRGVLGATAVLLVYLIVRFTILDVGTRTLGVTDSGYGFSVRNPSELVAMFGGAPWKFYIYNIVSAALTVLFSEPRSGVFQFTHFVVLGNVPAWSAVNVTVSTISTLLIAANLIPRLRRWKQEMLERDDVVMLMFVAVLAANSAISYPYLKEVVMSPAGLFYAAALFIAVRDLLNRLRDRPSVLGVWLAIPLLLISLGWSLRAVTLTQTLRATAFVNRNDWAAAEEREDEVRPQWRSRHRDAERLVVQLRDEVVNMPVPQPYTMPRWTRAWFDPY